MDATTQIKVLTDLRTLYEDMKNKHHDMVKQYDAEKDHVGYITERTMEAYCRGCVSAYDAAITTIRTGLNPLAGVSNERK